MSVVPGLGGQKFINSSLDKVLFLKQYREESKLDYFIGIDGGVNGDNGIRCFQSGADVIVSGSYLVKNISLEKINSLLVK